MMLGVLGLFAASCDDAPEAPKPQENPQEPIFASGDITYIIHRGSSMNMAMAGHRGNA